MLAHDALWHHPLGGWDDIPYDQRVVIIIMAVFALIVVAVVVVLIVATISSLIDRWKWRNI